MLEPEQKIELEVSNFGPIISAKVDVRPLTVFIGPSNTGKSYLATLLYALHKFFGGESRFIGSGYRRRFFDLDMHELPGKDADALFELAQSIITDSETSRQHKICLTQSTAEAIQTAFGKDTRLLENEIKRCFGIGEARSLIRKGRSNVARIALRLPTSNTSKSVEHVLTLLSQATQFTSTIPSEVPLSFTLKSGSETRRSFRILEARLLEAKSDRNSRRLAKFDIQALIRDALAPPMIGPLRFPAFYLPADRTGVMHAHSVVVSALIGSAPKAALRPAARTPVLSGVLADFLEQLIELDRPRRLGGTAFEHQSIALEEKVLNGSVRVARSPIIDYPSFAYRPKGWKEDLALANASSMVSELAPLVLYLRHLVVRNNVLIVEEPESHLHPAMQVELTRQIAALVNSGVRVIVTTHSEWLLEELANIIRRSEIPEAARGQGYEDKFVLRSDQVGAWLFEPKLRPKGSIVKEILLDESGQFPTDYDAVAIALHNNWAEISTRIRSAHD